jgi:hypothetical protein
MSLDSHQYGHDHEGLNSDSPSAIIPALPPLCSLPRGIVVPMELPVRDSAAGSGGVMPIYWNAVNQLRVNAVNPRVMNILVCLGSSDG